VNFKNGKAKLITLDMKGMREAEPGKAGLFGYTQEETQEEMMLKKEERLGKLQQFFRHYLAVVQNGNANN